jgi:hypothetical protein
MGVAGVKRSQSRQSAKLFLQSSELGLLQPLTRRRVCPPTLWFRGEEGHTRWRKRGCESPNSNEGLYTVVLFIYMYFVEVAKEMWHVSSGSRDVVILWQECGNLYVSIMRQRRGTIVAACCKSVLFENTLTTL